MAIEQLVNDPGTTLNGTINNSVTSLVVASSTGYPTSGNFRILIESELLLVTAVSGTTWTVTRGIEGTTAASHTSGVAINHILTAAALSELLAEVNQFDVIANRPTAPRTGTRFVGSDSVFDESRWNGSTWDYFVAGMKCNPATTSTFVTAAQGSNGTEVSFSNANDALIWKIYGTSGNNLCIRVAPVPSTPYRKRLRCRFDHPGNSFEMVGICLYDGTKANTYGIGSRNDASTRILAYNWSDLATPGQNVFNQAVFPTFRGSVFEFWLEDDGTNRNFSIVHDGINPVNILTESNTSFLTPTKLGVGSLIYGGSSHPSTITILDWSDV